MEVNSTEYYSGKIMERIHNTLNNLEQMSYDSINTTDQLVTLLSQAREYNAMMRSKDEEKRLEASENMGKILDQILNITFEVNNLSHQLEKETVYQRDTVEDIGRAIEFLCSMVE